MPFGNAAASPVSTTATPGSSESLPEPNGMASYVIVFVSPGASVSGASAPRPWSSRSCGKDSCRAVRRLWSVIGLSLVFLIVIETFRRSPTVMPWRENVAAVASTGRGSWALATVSAWAGAAWTGAACAGAAWFGAAPAGAPPA